MEKLRMMKNHQDLEKFVEDYFRKIWFFLFVFQLELMSKEELIKLVKNQIGLKKKLEIKITDLTNQIDDEQSKSSKLALEVDEFKINQSKLEEELNVNIFN
jgi:hypothetical protein